MHVVYIYVYVCIVALSDSMCMLVQCFVQGCPSSQDVDVLASQLQQGAKDYLSTAGAHL